MRCTFFELKWSDVLWMPISFLLSQLDYWILVFIDAKSTKLVLLRGTQNDSQFWESGQQHCYEREREQKEWEKEKRKYISDWSLKGFLNGIEFGCCLSGWMFWMFVEVHLKPTWIRIWALFPRSQTSFWAAKARSFLELQTEQRRDLTPCEVEGHVQKKYCSVAFTMRRKKMKKWQLYEYHMLIFSTSILCMCFIVISGEIFVIKKLLSAKLEKKIHLK